MDEWKRKSYIPVLTFQWFIPIHCLAKAVHSLARIRSVYFHSVFCLCRVRHLLFIHMQPVTCPLVYGLGRCSSCAPCKSWEVRQLVITGYYHTPLPDKLSTEDRSFQGSVHNKLLWNLSMMTIFSWCPFISIQANEKKIIPIHPIDPHSLFIHHVLYCKIFKINSYIVSPGATGIPVTSSPSIIACW